MTRGCDVEGCNKAHRARGLCATHYNQQAKAEGRLDYATEMVRCAFCAQVCEKRVDPRRPIRYCSFECRDLARIERAPDGDCMAAVRGAPRMPRTRTPKPPPTIEGSCLLEWRCCGWCGEQYPCNPDRASRAYCSESCVVRAKRCRRKGRETGDYGYWTWSDFMRMAARFDYRCAYCGEKPERLDPDHVVPLSKGGPNVLANLLPSCLLCNSDKRDLLLHEWETDRERRHLPTRRTSWAPEDARYWHLTFSTQPHAA
jgi:hypothetical protein